MLCHFAFLLSLLPVIAKWQREWICARLEKCIPTWNEIETGINAKIIGGNFRTASQCIEFVPFKSCKIQEGTNYSTVCTPCQFILIARIINTVVEPTCVAGDSNLDENMCFLASNYILLASSHFWSCLPTRGRKVMCFLLFICKMGLKMPSNIQNKLFTWWRSLWIRSICFLSF